MLLHMPTSSSASLVRHPLYITHTHTPHSHLVSNLPFKVGIINVVIIMAFLVRWRWLPQAAAEGQDLMDSTPADFAVLLQNLDVSRDEGDKTLDNFLKRIWADNTTQVNVTKSNPNGTTEVLPKKFQDPDDYPKTKALQSPTVRPKASTKIRAPHERF